MAAAIRSTDAPPQSFPWDAVLHFGLGLLRLTPCAFWSLSLRELMVMAAAPASAAVVRAGFRFDVPVRFDTDRIEIDLEAFRAGRIPSIPLIEVMP